jgi:hypothetical protein
MVRLPAIDSGQPEQDLPANGRREVHPRPGRGV